MERQKRLYDEKVCWDKYMSWGAAATVNKLWRWHRDEMGFGSRMGVVFAMWRWAIRNPEECYPQYKEWHNQNSETPEELSFEGFLKDVLQFHIKGYRGSVIGKKAYKRFCNQWNLEA